MIFVFHLLSDKNRSYYYDNYQDTQHHFKEETQFIVKRFLAKYIKLTDESKKFSNRPFSQYPFTFGNFSVSGQDNILCRIGRCSRCGTATIGPPGSQHGLLSRHRILLFEQDLRRQTRGRTGCGQILILRQHLLLLRGCQCCSRCRS